MNIKSLILPDYFLKVLIVIEFLLRNFFFINTVPFPVKEELIECLDFQSEKLVSSTNIRSFLFYLLAVNYLFTHLIVIYILYNIEI